MLHLDVIKGLFKASPSASIILYPDAPFFRIAWVNQSCLLHTGAELSDLLGLSIFEVLADPGLDRGQMQNNTLHSALTQALDSQGTATIRTQGYKGTNQTSGSDWDCSTYPLFDEEDKVAFIALSLQETIVNAGTVNLDNSLLVEGALDHPLFQDYPEAVFTLGTEGEFLSANKVFLEIAECSCAELLKLSFTHFIADEDLEAFQGAIKGKVLNFDTKIVTFKGKSRFLNLTHLPIVSDQKVVGVYFIAKDITSVVQDQQKLKQQQEQLDAHYKKTFNILERITDGFFVVNKDWIVTYWNKEAETILQLPREKIIGRSLWQIYPELADSEVYLAYQQGMQGDTSVHVEEYFETSDLWLEISIFPTDEGLFVHFKDISSRKRSELKVNELASQYQDLFDLSPLPQFVYGTDDCFFKDVNRAAIEHYGYSKAEFLSLTIMDITPQEDISTLKQVLEEKVRLRIPHRGTFRHLKKSGERIDVQVDGNPIVYKGAGARLVLAVDITEKLRTQRALQQSEERYKALVQDGSDMVGILNSKGEYLYVNHTTKRILGIAPEFFIGKNAFDFIHEKDQPRFMSTLAQLPPLQSMKIPAFLFTDSAGKYRWIDTTVTNMTHDPAVGGIVANSRDVTERIVNEMKIQQSIERFDIVSKATSDAIWDLDVTTGRIVWNKAIKALFGYKVGMYKREWWEARVHPDDLPRVSKKVTSTIRAKKSRLVNEYRFRCADNSYKNVLDRAFLIFDASGALIRIIGSMQDITAREKYIQTIEAQNERLKEIAWTQSHIVRVPLANIMGLVELLTENMDESGPQKELIAHLSSSSAELDDIIKWIIKKTELYGITADNTVGDTLSHTPGVDRT